MDKINFQNGTSGNTPLNANKLNLMQTNIENAINGVATEVNAEKGHILYQDATGTNGDVTLSEVATNYEEIEVFADRVNRQLYIKIETTHQYIALSQIRNSGENLYIYAKEYLVSGNILKVENARLVQIDASGIKGFSNSDDIYITKVIGYNKKA